MKTERQRFIDACLLEQFRACQSQNPGFVVARAVAFWEERELERKRFEEANPDEAGSPRLRKTKGEEPSKVRRTG